MNTVYLLLAKYDAPRMNVEQIADFMNVSVSRIQNRIYRKDMPFPVYKEGGGYFADLNDVAEYHDRMRATARATQDAIERSMA